MSDLISRQAAIDIVRNIIVKEVTPAYMLIDKAEVMTELMMMPSAQPELAQDLHNACIDAISRQAAIELIENESRKWGDEYGVSDVLCDLADLPSAQPEKRTEERTKTHACDCISRKEALRAFGLSEKTRKYGGDHSGYDTRMLYEIQDVLEGLPSVQPPARCIAEIKIDKDELEELVAKSMTNIAQPEQFNPCIICQEFDCTGCKFRRT